jgi:site-specific recombinase XerD
MSKGVLKLTLNPNGRTNKDGSSTIYVQYRFKGKRRLWDSGEKIHTDLWNQKDQCVTVRGKNEKLTRINTVISLKKGEIQRIIDLSVQDHISPTIEYIESELERRRKSVGEKDERKVTGEKTFHNHLDDYLNYSKENKTYNTWKQINTTINFLKEFDANKKLTFEKIDQEFFEQFNKFLLDKNMSNNTVWCYIKHTKAFMNYTFKKKLHKNLDHQLFTIQFKDPEIHIPTKEQIMGLMKLKNLSPKLERTRDLFVLNCYIGARFEDFIKFSTHNFKEDGIEYIQAKTKDPEIIFVPYFQISKQILEKYNYQLPKITNQKFNKNLKELLEESELFDEKKKIVSFYGARTVTEVIPFYSLLSSHSCRKYFCSMNINSEMNTQTAMALSGHKNLKSFRRYLKINKETLIEQIRKIDNNAKKYSGNKKRVS